MREFKLLQNNEHLVPHGIQNEYAVKRMHYCHNNKTIYMMDVAELKELIDNNNYRVVSTMPYGAKYSTSEGYLVPISDVMSLVVVKLPNNLKIEGWNGNTSDTSTCGRIAEIVCKFAIDKQLVNLGEDAKITTNYHNQVTLGIDILTNRSSISAKFDNRISETGNLYIERAERNAQKKH